MDYDDEDLKEDGDREFSDAVDIDDIIDEEDAGDDEDPLLALEELESPEGDDIFSHGFGVEE
ncbi:MAG: hypothetical protein WC795_02060 [Candidatus Paceibacterota bacterium]|jgi:hypothetical protein